MSQLRSDILSLFRIARLWPARGGCMIVTNVTVTGKRWATLSATSLQSHPAFVHPDPPLPGKRGRSSAQPRVGRRPRARDSAHETACRHERR